MKKILLIEDEPDVVEMLRSCLELNNYKVVAAYDGTQGLEKARSEKPDLIILDLMLPRIDGYQLCRMLKFDVKFPKIPIIMFTARAQQSDIIMGEDVGADAYIVKPSDLNVLLKKIKELLKS